jgi:Ca2+-binding EF-hand superfamily protein
LRPGPVSAKLSTIFELCDEDESGAIDRKEFYNLLKYSAESNSDRQALKSFGKENKLENMQEIEFSKQEFKKTCLKNK